MKFKLIIVIGIITLYSVFCFAESVSAATQYKVSEVAAHSSTTDCWMIFENKVYDVTSYLRSHDRYMDIRSWCGTDMTVAFQTKDGSGQDHRTSTYSLLNSYYIGEISASTTISTGTEPVKTVDTPNPITSVSTPTSTSSNTTQKSTSSISPSNPYHFFLPFLLTLFLYFGSYYLAKVKNEKGESILSKQKLNFIWNIALILSLIPSAIFGVYMIARYSFTDLAKVDFDFMYWHVEGSIVFVSIILGHIINRLPMLLAQMRSLRR